MCCDPLYCIPISDTQITCHQNFHPAVFLEKQQMENVIEEYVWRIEIVLNREQKCIFSVT